MPAEPTNAYEEMFLKSYDFVPQQKRSRLMRISKPVAEFTTGATFHKNRVLKATSQIKSGRFADTPTNPIGHETRLGWRHARNTNVPVNTEDLRRQISDPTSEYVMAVRAEHARTLDDNFIETLVGGQTLQEISADGQTKVQSVVQLPASQKVPHGGTGLATGKLIDALQILNANEVAGEYGDEVMRYCIIGSQQVSDLLGDEKVVNRDYREKLEALMTGWVMNHAGWWFIRSERLKKDGTTRRCIACTSMAIEHGSDPDLKKLRIGERADKSYDRGIYAEWELGSLRCDEKYVVEIGCTEPAA